MAGDEDLSARAAGGVWFDSASGAGVHGGGAVARWTAAGTRAGCEWVAGGEAADLYGVVDRANGGHVTGDDRRHLPRGRDSAAAARDTAAAAHDFDSACA